MSKTHYNDAIAIAIDGKKGYISGFSGTRSAYVRDKNGLLLSVPNKNYKLISLSKIKLVHHNNNWISSTKGSK